ncbi:hypothetical protein niasHT_027015 [Heterodera trifolii]|uniref:BTB domain-containing protein n=1 Tax=Heterodera trifolii TaxID=157864 RepID=A0ABD2K0Y9_9BILA
MSSVLTRYKNLLLTGTVADLVFVFDEGGETKVVRAHRQILWGISDAFDCLISEDEKKDKPPTKPVAIKNIDFGVFKAILLFLYCGDMAEVKGEILFDVFIAADQYFMRELVAECLRFDFSKIPNIFAVYAECLKLKGPNFEHFAQNCLRFIDANAKLLLISDEFLHIDHQLLCKILERDGLTICDEFDVWKAAIRWAKNGCGEEDPSALNLRRMLRDALYLIRFPIITERDFLDHIVPTGVLDADEVLSVFVSYLNSGHPNANISIHPRVMQNTGGSRGRLMLDIENVEDFLMEEEGARESAVKIIRGLPWQFTVTAKSFTDVVVKYLDISIQCNAQNDSPWSCPCTVTVRLVSKVVEEDYTRKFFHIFHEGSNRFNIDDFVTSEDVKDGTRFNANGTVRVAIDLITE